MADVITKPDETTPNPEGTTPIGTTPATNDTGAGKDGVGGDDTPSYADLVKQVSELSAKVGVLTKTKDKLASENGDLRKQLRAKMTDEEAAAKDKAERDEAVQNEIKDLRAKLNLNEAVKRYMSMKMSEEMAMTVAKAELDGDMDTVTASINAHMEAQKKEAEEKVKAELFAQMPNPQSGNGNGQIDYEKQYHDKLAAGDVQGAIEAQLLASQQAMAAQI